MIPIKIGSPFKDGRPCQELYDTRYTNCTYHPVIYLGTWKNEPPVELLADIIAHEHLEFILMIEHGDDARIKYDNLFEKCPICGGRGEVSNPHPMTPPVLITQLWCSVIGSPFTCHGCGGTGYRESEEKKRG